MKKFNYATKDKVWFGVELVSIEPDMVFKNKVQFLMLAANGEEIKFTLTPFEGNQEVARKNIMDIASMIEIMLDTKTTLSTVDLIKAMKY